MVASTNVWGDIAQAVGGDHVEVTSLINDASQRWTINLGIRNITDTRFYDQILSQPLAPGNLAAAGINEPRTFTQSISFAF